jgi:putative transposase
LTLWRATTRTPWGCGSVTQSLIRIRVVYNKALELQKANFEAGGKFIGEFPMAKLLTQWRNGTETPWLKESPVHPLQHALKDLNRAYRNFFRQARGVPVLQAQGAHRQLPVPGLQAVRARPGQ